MTWPALCRSFRERLGTYSMLAAALTVVPAAALWAAGPAPVAIPPLAACARAFDRGDYPLAISLARERLKALPADAGARIVMSRAEAALGHFEDAYEGFRRVLSRQPRNTDALYYVAILGGVLAQGEYDRLFASAPDSARAHQLLGGLFEAQDRPAEAEAEYKAGLGSAPTSLDLLIALGDLTRHQSRFEEALAYYGRAAQQAPRNYDVEYGRGVSHSYRQEYALAIESFREALRLEPSSAPARLALGHALLQAGQAGAAVPELAQAAALEPRMLQAQYLLGRAYTALGRTQEAAAAFEKVKKLVQGQGLEAEAARQSADPLGQTKTPRPLPSPEDR
jgi:protein O-GlcNAc transferase